MLSEKNNFQYNFNMIFLLVHISVFIIFISLPIIENAHAENDLDIEIPFYYFHNYQNLDNHQLESSNIISNQFIVYLKEENELQEENKSIDPLEFFNSELKNTGTELLYIYDYVSKGFAIKIYDNKKDKVLEQLKNNPLVEYIGQDKKITAFIDKNHQQQQTNNQQILPISIDRVKDDDNNDLSLAAGRELGGENPLSIDADIAILDTGIDLDHSDLNVFHEKTFIPGTNNADDDHGHGTHLAGIAAATDNSFGIVGIAPGARLWAIKVLESAGMGDISTLIKGLDYINQYSNQVDIAVLSLGCECESGALDIAIKNTVEVGITVVVAAGNEGKDARTFTPANNPEVITVSAIVDTDGKCGGEGPSSVYGTDDTLASFSNFGKVIDIAAPGVDIYSTFKSNSYTKLTGTSMAAPHVAGAAALYISSHLGASPNDVKNYLINTGTNLKDSCNNDNGNGYFSGDRDGYHEPLLHIKT
jgi:subtilisin family serine protease